MCAATTMLLALVPEGGHIVTTTDCYRRTRQFIQTMLPKMGISVLFHCPATSICRTLWRCAHTTADCYRRTHHLHSKHARKERLAGLHAGSTIFLS